MAEIDEAAPGFNRRSLIKKGVVAGGIAATLPIISTFNAPAFAVSPGTKRVQFDMTQTAVGIGFTSSRVAPGATACEIQAAWTAATPDTGIPMTVTPNALVIPGTYTIALTGTNTPADCSIAAARSNNGGSCHAPVAINANSVSFPYPALAGSWSVFIILNCAT